MLPNKKFNMEIPRSQQNGGRNLDEACPEIYDAGTTAMVDGYKGTIPEATATKVIQGRKS